MSNFFNPDYLRHLCQKYGFKPGKKYGQNFLIDRAVIDDIIIAAGLTKQDTVIEVGPGFGTLTVALARQAGKVIAFEIEKKLMPYWEKELKKLENLEIIWGNVLRSFVSSRAMPTGRQAEHNLAKGHLCSPLGSVEMTGDYKAVSNLPYQITSPIIRLFLESDNPPSEMVLMTQKEVAERICAGPGQMSLLSVSVQYYAQPEIVRLVPRSSFWPEPAVDSAVVKMTIDDKRKTIEEAERFFRVVKAGFAQRRKLLAKNLKPVVGKQNKTRILEIFVSLGLSPKARAQELSMDQWRGLVRALEIVPT